MAGRGGKAGPEQDVDEKELKDLIARVVGDLAGSVAVQLMYIGDRLGLFKVVALAPGGVTSAELAQRTQCHIRYVETWCQACVAHSFMETERGAESALQEDGRRRYWMTGAQREVLANEGGRSFQCGAAQLLSASAQATPAMMERGFRCLGGGGVSWSHLGDDAREGVARMNAVTHRELLPSWVGAVPEARRALGARARVLDVGCGCGASTLSLAAAFPDAEVLGIDPDAESIAAAGEELRRRGLGNARFEPAALEDVTGEPFDLALAYDCIHDMTDPFAALASLRKLLRVGGVALWFEPHGSDDPYENREIFGARMVAGIALNCVTTSMAAGGAGLGAHGCTPARAEALARRAGFGEFRRERELKGARYRNNVYVMR